MKVDVMKDDEKLSAVIVIEEDVGVVGVVGCRAVGLLSINDVLSLSLSLVLCCVVSFLFFVESVTDRRSRQKFPPF